MIFLNLHGQVLLVKHFMAKSIKTAKSTLKKTILLKKGTLQHDTLLAAKEKAKRFSLE